MGYDPINKMPHIQRMNSLRGDPVNLDGSKINIQDKEVTPDKIKRAVSALKVLFGYSQTSILRASTTRTSVVVVVFSKSWYSQLFRMFESLHM